MSTATRPAATPPAATLRTGRGGGAWLPVALGASLIGGVLAVAGPDPADSLLPTCTLRERFGLDCPGCGGTRALHALLHGDLATAIDHNLLVVLLAPLALVACIGWALRARRIGSLDLPPRVVPVMVGVATLVVGFGLARNVGSVAALEHLASGA